jgi:UPF0755 protein
MTVRGGRKPRANRFSGVQRDPTTPVVVDAGWDDYTPPDPKRMASRRRPGEFQTGRDYRKGRSGGLRRLLGFVLFVAVIGGLVVGGLQFVVRPVVTNGIVDWAAGNPTALQVPFVSDIVRGTLWSAISKPVDPTNKKPVVIVIGAGSTPLAIGEQLAEPDVAVISDVRAFVYESIEKGVTANFQVGRHVVAKSMTIDQIIAILTSPPVAPPTVHLVFREGLRIEQMVAELEDKELHPDDPTAPLTMNVSQFYDLAMHPPADLLAQYKWLQLPAGASLEGFLFPATYDVAPDTTPGQLIGLLLDAFVRYAPAGFLKLPPAQIYRTVQIAALVQTEAKKITSNPPKNTDDGPLVAGAYLNRLNPRLWPTGLLDADPTLNYANDSVWLQSHPIESWVNYTFWTSIKTTGPLSQVVFPGTLAAYNTYHHAGLPPMPICSPGADALWAAMNANTAAGYLYFLSKNDGSGTLAFAKTQAEQNANLKKYGYTK